MQGILDKLPVVLPGVALTSVHPSGSVLGCHTNTQEGVVSNDPLNAFSVASVGGRVPRLSGHR